jgi:hypothetical protein
MVFAADCVEVACEVVQLSEGGDTNEVEALAGLPQPRRFGPRLVSLAGESLKQLVILVSPPCVTHVFLTS